MGSPTDVTHATPTELGHIKQQVDALLLGYCDTQIVRARAINPAYGRLWTAIRAVTAAGGKRLRPYLTVQAYKGFGGSDEKMIMQIAAAWELLHISLLIHDDIIDRDYVRHGQLNVAGQLRESYRAQGLSAPDAEHYANSAALLAGDLLLAASGDFLVTSALTSDEKSRINAIMSEAIFTVAGGELLDTEAVMLPLAAVDAHQVASLKTASYSIVGPLLSGAVLAGADEATIELLRQFGDKVGIGYQLVDDLLGIFGDEHMTGKSITSDLVEGKRTVLLKEAYNRSNVTHRKQIDIILGKSEITEVDVALLRDRIVLSGAKVVAETMIAGYKQQALRLLESLALTDGSKHELRWLVNYALSRNA